MNRDIITIGGSAGSLASLLSIAAAFPADFEGNIFVAIHIGHARSQLPELLARVGKLPVLEPRDREATKPGHIYIASTDRHLLVEPNMVRASRGPREHFTRPAIDPLFRSAAIAFGERVVGVVLSGGGSDGAAGLDAIKRAGGLAVVLDPRDAVAADMPEAAAEVVHPDYIVPGNELPALLVRLSRETIPDTQAKGSRPLPEPVQTLQRPLALTCPDCGGTLRKAGDGPAAQFRCHIGHVFSGGDLSPVQIRLLEKALDTAQRVLNERIELARQMAEDSRTAGRQHISRHWDSVRAEAEKQVDAIRRVLPDQLETQDVAPEIAH